MNHAFVLENETILCRQTPTGWLPLPVALPNGSSNKPLANYQLGYVKLQTSLAPSHWQATNAPTTDDDAPATSAISRHYAQSNHIKLPKIIADNDLAALKNNSWSSTLKSNSNHDEINAFIAYRQLLSQLSVALADQLSHAIQLLRWQADTQFCSRCSAPVTSAAYGERSMVCSVCRLRQYPRVQPCVITAITRPNPLTGETQILLAHHHRYGQTSLPLQYGLIAGFVEVGESLEHAVVREVGEEVGISLTDIRYVSSQPWPFPSNLMLGFRASYVSGDIVIQEDELSHADFFDLSNLPKIPFRGSIAYDLIAQIAHEQGVSL